MPQPTSRKRQQQKQNLMNWRY